MFGYSTVKSHYRVHTKEIRRFQRNARVDSAREKRYNPNVRRPTTRMDRGDFRLDSIKKIDGKRNTVIYEAYTELREMILSGMLEQGERLPSETELAQEMGISRSSLREAIGNLEREGLLVKKQGIGTFVTSLTPIIRGGIERLTGVMDFVKANGYEAQSRLISFNASVADPALASLLNLPPGSIVYNLTTIKLASEVPVALCVDSIPESVFKNPVKPENLQYSLFEGLKKDHDIEIFYAEAEIIPMVSDQNISSKLQIAEGEAVLLLSQIHFDRDNNKILYSKSYFPSGKFTFRLIRKR